MGGRGSSSGFTTKSTNNLTDAQKEALDWYASGEGMWINQYLRGRFDTELSPNEKVLLDALTKATQTPIDKNTTLYRSVDASAVFGNISDLEYENLMSGVVYGLTDKVSQVATDKFVNTTVGKTITEKGFMSTTTDAQIAHEWGGFSGSSKPIVLKLKAPKGINGADLTKHIQKQSEVLLTRGQSYRVDKIASENGNIVVHATLK